MPKKSYAPGKSKAALHRQVKRKLATLSCAYPNVSTNGYPSATTSNSVSTHLVANDYFCATTSNSVFTHLVANDYPSATTSNSVSTHLVADDYSSETTSNSVSTHLVANDYPSATTSNSVSTHLVANDYFCATTFNSVSTHLVANDHPSETTSNSVSTHLVANDYPSATTSNSISTHLVAKNSSEDDNSIENMLGEIINLVQTHHVSMKFTSNLLKVLKTHNCFHSKIPADARTLLGTIKSYPADIIDMHPGLFYYFGIEHSILFCCSDLLESLDQIKLVISIDGLPLSKSSGSCFWPILGYIKPYRHAVFIIGLYWGLEKPTSANDFLSQFVQEATALETNGFNVNSTSLPFSIDHFCCDAPAKSYVLRIKGHGGYSSCLKCNCQGDYAQRRVYFPVTRGERRTHEGFVTQIDPDHHLEGDTTILTKLNIDIIQTFPLDYMHLILLGVVKKLLSYMISKGPRHLRISRTFSTEGQISKFDLICSLLTHHQLCTPFEFARKCRTLHELPRFKATELRLFLLYLGPVILFDNIPEKVYTLFLYLSIATHIFINPCLSHLKCFGGTLMTRFVLKCSKLYGEHVVSHNVHGLLHVIEDYETLGPLDSYSAFTFENFLGILKVNLQKSNKPLQQIVKRYYEKNFTCHQKQHSEHPLLKGTHKEGPLVRTVPIVSQHHFCEIKGLRFKSKSKSKADCYFLSESDELVEIHNFITTQNSEVLIVGYTYQTTNFFEDPINSKDLFIFKLLNLIPEVRTFCWRELKKKCMVLEANGLKVSIPLAHSNV